MVATTEPTGTTRAASPPSPGDLPLDVVFDLLSNERRRRVLRHLQDQPGAGTLTLGDLAEHVSGLENDKAPQAISSAERKRVYISLYQCHLPKLADADVVDFDGDRKTVELADQADAVTPYLAKEQELEAPSGDRDSAGLLATVVSWFRG